MSNHAFNIMSFASKNLPQEPEHIFRVIKLSIEDRGKGTGNNWGLDSSILKQNKVQKRTRGYKSSQSLSPDFRYLPFNKY